MVQIMAWSHQATSHYLSQCWPRSTSAYGITRLPWVYVSSHVSLKPKQTPRWCRKGSHRTSSSWQFHQTSDGQWAFTTLLIYLGFHKWCLWICQQIHESVDTIALVVTNGAWKKVDPCCTQTKYTMGKGGGEGDGDGKKEDNNHKDWLIVA